MTAIDRETNFVILLKLYCVLKDGMCRLGTAPEPLAEGTSRNRNTAGHPPTRPSTLAQQGNYPEKVTFSKWHKGLVEDNLGFCDVWYAKQRHSCAPFLSPVIFMVNCH